MSKSQRNWLAERPVYWIGLGFIATYGSIPEQVKHVDDFFDKKVRQMTMR